MDMNDVDTNDTDDNDEKKGIGSIGYETMNTYT